MSLGKFAPYVSVELRDAARITIKPTFSDLARQRIESALGRCDRQQLTTAPSMLRWVRRGSDRSRLVGGMCRWITVSISVSCWRVSRIDELLGLSTRTDCAEDTIRPPPTTVASRFPVRERQ